MRIPLSFKYLPQSSDLSVVKTEESQLTIIISDRLKWKTDVSINNMIRPVFIHVSTTPVKVFLIFKGLD